MNHHNGQRTTDNGQRSAFTLVELLIVIAVIGILLSLMTVGAFALLGNQKKSNTETTIGKSSKLLDQHWKAVIDDARNETIPVQVLSLAGNDAERARVIWIKLRLKQQFPTSFQEALQPAPTSGPLAGAIAPEPAYQRYLATRVVGNTNAAFEPAACLLMALTAKNRRGAEMDADAMSALEKADTDNDGIKELVDAWKTPLGFYRWPTGNQALDNSYPVTSGPQVNFRDPQDATGRLLGTAWYSAGNRTFFENACHPIQNPWRPAPSSIYLVPVIASAGPNQTLGLTWGTMAPDGSGKDADNIYSYLLR